MTIRNNLVFTDENIEALPYVEKMYSHPDWIKSGQSRGKLKIRVGRETKTFILAYEGRKINLGFFSANYGVINAMTDSLGIVAGDVHAKPKIMSETFERLAGKVFADKRRKGRKHVHLNEWVFYNKVPEWLKKKQIHRICREDVMKWKAKFLMESSPMYWNKVVAIPNSVWNESAKTYAFSCLEDRKNPFSNLQEETAKKRLPVPTLSDIKYIWRAFVEHGNEMASMVVKLKILTGMHLSEIEKLQLKDIQGDWIVLDVGHHKNSNLRNGIVHRIYMTSQMKQLVNNWIEFNDIRQPEQLLFLSEVNTPVNHKSFHKVWQRGLEGTNLNFRMDRLRHTLITNMMEDEIPSEYITGHCYLKNTQTKHYIDWQSDVMKAKFIKSASHWQDKIYRLVKDHWL